MNSGTITKSNAAAATAFEKIENKMKTPTSGEEKQFSPIVWIVFSAAAVNELNLTFGSLIRFGSFCYGSGVLLFCIFYYFTGEKKKKMMMDF